MWHYQLKVNALYQIWHDSNVENIKTSTEVNEDTAAME